MSTQFHHSACPILGAAVGPAGNKGTINVKECVSICVWATPTHSGSTVGCGGVLFRLCNVCTTWMGPDVASVAFHYQTSAALSA